jgi:adenosylhomocysteine nucleosidase
VAGATAEDLSVGDVVIGDSAVQHDVDVTALGYTPGTVPGSPESWQADDELVAVATAVARTIAARSSANGAPSFVVRVGTVATGDQFISSPARAAELRDSFGAVCAEMEGAACAQVCAAWAVPFVIVRSISDNANHTATVDFRSFTRLAAERADQIVTGVLEALAEE